MGTLLLCVLVALGVLFEQAAPASAAHPSRWFWIDRGFGPVRIQCRLAVRKSGVAVYVARDASVSTNQARSVYASFVRHVLPLEMRIFGRPRNLLPINIVISPLDGTTMGYFDENDVPLRGHVFDPAHSNRANVLYVRPPDEMPDANGVTDTKEVAAHELQHLIEYRLRVVDRHTPAEANWLNEGLSFYAQLVTGFWTPRDAQKADAAAQNPAWQVTSVTYSSNQQGRQARVAYGRVGLFATYLAARYGSRFVGSVLRRKETGLTAIDRVLRGPEYDSRVQDAFSDWGVATYLHGSGAYGYGRFTRLLRCSPHLAASPVLSYPYDSARASQLLALKPWGQAYYQFVGVRPGTLHLAFTGDANAFNVAAVVQDSDGTSPRKIVRLRAQGDRQVLRLPGFGSTYDRVTLVVSDVHGVTDAAALSALDRYRIEASVNVRNNNRVARPAAATRLNAHFAVGSFPNV